MATVSIITATYNNGLFLEEALNSVVEQDHQEWEWIVIDNGSTDNTRALLEKHIDSRIRVFRNATNLGVSAARNQGLKEVKGDYFCFFDGDDILPKSSISARLKVFDTNAQIQFVDGKVIEFRTTQYEGIATYIPSYKGDPLPKLLSVSADVFKGNTWMIRKQKGIEYSFFEGLSHGEELLFYIQIAQGGHYAYTTEPVLYYRRHERSAMANVRALAHAYKELVKHVAKLEHISQSEVSRFAHICRSIAFKSLMKEGYYFLALRTLLLFRS